MDRALGLVGPDRPIFASVSGGTSAPVSGAASGCLVALAAERSPALPTAPRWPPFTVSRPLRTTLTYSRWAGTVHLGASSLASDGGCSTRCTTSAPQAARKRG